LRDPPVKPSTVTRRFSVVAGFYRTCVIDSLLETGSVQNSALCFRPIDPRE